MGETRVDVFCRTQALLGHREFHEVTDIADEPLGEFRRRPRPTALAHGLLVIERADLQGASGERGKRHKAMRRCLAKKRENKNGALVGAP